MAPSSSAAHRRSPSTMQTSCPPDSSRATFITALFVVSLLASPTSCFGSFFTRPSHQTAAPASGNQDGRGLFRNPPGLGELLGAAANYGEDQPSTANNNAKGGDTKDHDAKSKSSPFEEMVRKMTGNEDYKFGDLTKTAVSSATHVVEDVVHSATGSDDYEFGDLTKGAVTKTANITKGAVSMAAKPVGNVLKYSETTLSLMREANIHEVVELSHYFWTSNLEYKQRKEVFVVFVQLGAILVLAYSFVANVSFGLVSAAAWTMVSASTGASPLAPGMWPKFLQTQSTLNMIFGGPFLPARVALTIPWFFRYRKMLVGVAVRSPIRERYPVLNRCFTLTFFWIVANLGVVGLFSFGVTWAGSLWTGVPIFPAA